MINQQGTIENQTVRSFVILHNGICDVAVGAVQLSWERNEITFKIRGPKISNRKVTPEDVGQKQRLCRSLNSMQKNETFYTICCLYI